MTEPRSVHYAKAQRLYAALDALSEDMTVDDLPVRAYQGGVTALYKAVKPGLSMTDYGRLFRGLRECGCITKLQTGSRNTVSILALHHAPTEEQWAAYERSPLTRKLSEGKLREQVQLLREEVQHQRTLIEHLAKEVGVELPQNDPPANETPKT